MHFKLYVLVLKVSAVHSEVMPKTLHQGSGLKSLGCSRSSEQRMSRDLKGRGCGVDYGRRLTVSGPQKGYHYRCRLHYDSYCYDDDGDDDDDDQPFI